MTNEHTETIELTGQELASLLDATREHLASAPDDHAIRSLQRKANDAYERYEKRRYGDDG